MDGQKDERVLKEVNTDSAAKQESELPWRITGMGTGIIGVVFLLLFIISGIHKAAYKDIMQQPELTVQDNLETTEKEPAEEEPEIDMTDEYSFGGNAAANLYSRGDGILAKMTGEETVYYYADLSGNLYRKSLSDDAWEIIHQGGNIGEHIYNINVDNIGGKYVYFEYVEGDHDVASRICRLDVETLQMEEIAYGEEPRLMCGKLYYLRSGDEKDSIYCMDLETYTEEILFEPTEKTYFCIENFSVTGEDIIFTSNDDVYKLTPQGELSTIYTRDCLEYAMVCGEYIFLIDFWSEYIIPVYKLDFNGNVIETYEMKEMPHTVLTGVHGEYLYLFNDEDKKFFRMRMDSGEMEVVLDFSDEMYFGFVNIVDETILLEFGTIVDGGMLSDLYAMPANGTDMTLEDCVHLSQVFNAK